MWLFLQVSKSDRSKSRESDHRGSRSSERERNRDEEHPSAASQAAARDRAIQKKRKEIDEVCSDILGKGIVINRLTEREMRNKRNLY